jgi:type I restriction enzyme S subunit
MKAKGKTPKDDSWKLKYKEPVAPNTSNLPELPEGWVWASAEQCTRLITDGEHITPERSESGVLLLSARNIQDGWLSLNKVDYVPEHIYEVLARRLVIESGDVLLSCSGSVGRSCVAPINLKFALVRSVAVLKPLAELGKFISYSIRSPLLQRQIEEKKTQTAQANIFQGKIKVLIFAIPPLSEQHKIIEEVERCLSVTEELEKVINKNLKRSEKLRQSILKKAFEGKLVPQDPTDEPADKLLERIKAEKAKREAEAKAKKKQKQPGKSQQLELF